MFDLTFEQLEYKLVKQRVDELMTGPPLGDGIGPRNTAWRINEEFGTNYQGHEIWRIWRQGKEWAKPEDDVYDER